MIDTVSIFALDDKLFRVSGTKFVVVMMCYFFPAWLLLPVALRHPDYEEEGAEAGQTLVICQAPCYEGSAFTTQSNLPSWQECAAPSTPPVPSSTAGTSLWFSATRGRNPAEVQANELSQNHRIFQAGRDLQGSLCPTLFHPCFS